MLTEQFKLEIGALKDSKNIAVAVSGGSDSLALLLLTSNTFTGSVTALIVDHALRTNSSAEAAQVADIVHMHGIESVILKWRHDGVKSNIMARARDARYEILTQWCKSNGADTLLVGHTKNDVAENFLIRSLRGSGIYGLAAIEREGVINDIKIFRPLLNFKKSELVSYLKDMSVAWIEDPTNTNTKFARTNVRNFISSNPTIDPDLLIDRLALTASNLLRAKDCIEQLCDKSFKQVVSIADDAVCIDYTEFKKLHIEIALKVLLRALAVLGDRQIPLRLDSLERLYEHLHAGNKSAKTLNACRVRLSNDSIVITKEHK